jgi:glucose-1-phosphate adenylyltransferase
MIQEHMESEADITVAVLPVERSRVKEFGILKTDHDGWIIDFVEKPQKEDEIHAMEIDKATFQQHGVQPLNRSHVASMGIYVFEKNVLVDCLSHEETVDFGMHVIPASIGEKKVRAYFFDGYWEDVGTMRSFYEANLALTDMVPEFDFFDESAPVFTHPRFLPGSKVNSCVVRSSILCEGSVLTECEIRNSIIGVRSIVHSGAEILNSVVMGADYYETIEDQLVVKESGAPAIGIGRGSVIRNAIVDKNARIGSNVKILNRQNAGDCDGDNYSIRDGIVVVHKNAVLPDNTVI